MKNDASKDVDFALILKIKAGDTVAFRQLVEKYKNVSLSLAVSILKDQSTAEDVLQDVFVKVFKSIDNFKFKSKFSTWLYRIVINSSYNALKKIKNNRGIEEVDNASVASDEMLGIEALNQSERRRYIIKAFDKLRPDEALVLRLFYLGELSMKEIQEITDFSIAKIKVDLHRGRDNMYFYLKKILGDEINNLL